MAFVILCNCHQVLYVQVFFYLIGLVIISCLMQKKKTREMKQKSGLAVLAIGRSGVCMETRQRGSAARSLLFGVSLQMMSTTQNGISWIF